MLLKNATIATLERDDDFGLIENGSILTKDDRISWVGQGAVPDGIEDHDLFRVVIQTAIDLQEDGIAKKLFEVGSKKWVIIQAEFEKHFSVI